MARQGKTPAETPAAAPATYSDTPGKRATAGDQAKAQSNEIYELRFDVLRSAMYHGAREHLLSFWHRVAITSGLLAGAAAITATLDGAPKTAVLAVGVAVSFFTICDLVFDWSGTASRHVRMKERFFGLLSEIDQSPNAEEEIRRFKARLAESYQEEPPVYHALNELMWNRAYESLSENFDPKNCRKVVGWRRRLAHFLPQRGHDFRPD